MTLIMLNYRSKNKYEQLLLENTSFILSTIVKNYNLFLIIKFFFLNIKK